MSNAILDLFLEAAWQTFAMVGISSLIALAAGVPLAVILVITAPGGLWEHHTVNRVLGPSSTVSAPPRLSSCWWRCCPSPG